MKKKLLSFVLSIAMLATFAPFVQAETEQTSQIKNIIYMIPDGGGYALLDFADDVKQAGGFDAEKFPYKTPTTTEEMYINDYLVGSMTTAPYEGGITDSAAAGTAMATGHKTYCNYLGVDNKKRPMANLVEAAQSVGKSTGLVATYEWMHATPGSFSAHAVNRTAYNEIYQQIENKGIDVVLGAGYGAVSSYATIQNAVDRGYTVVENKADLQAVKPGDKIWGNIANPSFAYDINSTSTTPTLAEMTDAAIRALSDNEEGFFLMVEGSKVDTGGHANDAVTTTSEYLAFDAAWKVAVDWAKGRTDTIVIGAPDHDTGGMTYTEGMTEEIASVQSGTNPESITWSSTWHTAQNVPVWAYLPAGVELLEGLNSVSGDTAATRGDYMNRTGNYVIDNTDIAPWLAGFMGVDLDALSSELYVNVTEIGIYMATTGKFIFNNGDKSVYKNQSVYYKDGKEISMGHKEALVLDGKVYVPAEIIDEEDWNYITEDRDGITGSGTLADPYIIDDAYDFIEFTGNLISGDTYSGKYILQAADIDLAGNEYYTGVTSSQTFAGTYNGGGYTLNLGLNTNSGQCPFPYVTGTIMNLGTTGYITNTAESYTAGIARSVRTGGKLINCYSTAALTGYSVSGLASSNNGTISNCYFGGTISASFAGSPIANSGTNYENTYYVEGCGKDQTNTGITKVSRTVATTTLAATLNNGRAAAATTAGVSTEDMSLWTQLDDSMPTFFFPIPTVTNVVVTPATATVNKGDGLQLSVVVEGEYEPSQEVSWSLEPESNCKGTYIADDGYLIVDPEETLASFTVMAKSKQNGSMAGICRITVGDEVLTEEDGTRARPYLIENEADFAEFTTNVLGGNKYTDQYIKQTANLDMADYTGYSGMGYGANFYGIYDGAGHTINVDIKSAADQCVFPYTYGTIMNVGITGSITTASYCGGLVRSLRAGGKIVNCWVTADLTGSTACGIASSNYGTIANSYFSGTRTNTTSNTSSPIANNNTGGVLVNNYYLGEEFNNATDMAEITAEQLEKNLYSWLNDARATSAASTGFTTGRLREWVAVAGASPVQKTDDVVEDTAITTALSNVAYVDGSVTGTITLTQCPEEYVAYVAIFNGTQMVAAEKQAVDSTSETFTITYTPADGTTYTVKLMLWDDGMAPCAAPATASVAK